MRLTWETRSMRVAVLVPIKDFRQAKQRLARVLSADERVELARRMATRVITAAAPYDVFVVCDDHDVAAFAKDLDAEVLWRPDLGLNGAIREGVQHIGRMAERVLIAHSDLPLARSFEAVMDTEGVAIVPDRHGRGTNVIALPADKSFSFHFGVGSYLAHQHEAVRHGLPVHHIVDECLGWDVDTPEDLDHRDLQEFLAWLPPRSPRKEFLS
jgi:2-phospho-L-lactate/phosphoenolpyruvate guanylyltransferase